jgi:hypothetical protein
MPCSPAKNELNDDERKPTNPMPIEVYCTHKTGH